MSGFVSTIPGPADPAQPTVIEHDGWYPATDLGALRDEMRIGEVVTLPRLIGAVKGAMLTVARELRSWKTVQVAAGAAALEAVEADEVDFESALVAAYRRAIYCFAAAELAETYRDITATKPGAELAEEKALSADDHRRNGTHAVRDILGVTRTAVELI